MDSCSLDSVMSYIVTRDDFNARIQHKTRFLKSHHMLYEYHGLIAINTKKKIESDEERLEDTILT
jgi:hypothetical protein